jgi:putative transposase
MLTESDFSVLCLRLNLASQAQAVLSTIQSSPPSRRVGSGGKNVPVTYTSRKMGVTIQAESYKNELAGVYEMEHDPTVFAFYDQPPPIKLQYQAKSGRMVGVLHTPDYFVIRADALGWEEWKTEEDLVRLAEKMPHRYVHAEDGTWHCPPGEQVAAPLGFYYRVRSSCDIHWVFQRNLRFLSYYLRTDTPSVKEAAKEEAIALTTSHPGITLAELLQRLERATSDDIYMLLATEQLYVDVYAAPLAELEQVHVFCDERTARAWATALAQDTFSDMSRPHTLLIEPGASVVWDGKPCTILYQGQTTTTLLTEDRRPLEVSNSHFQALVAQGKLVGHAAPLERGSLSVQVRERMMNASHAALAEANRRYAIIQPVLEGHALVDTTTPARTIRYWAARYREAAQTLGCGYVGLLPKLHQSGNRRPRLPEPVMTALGEFVEHSYETHKQKRKYEVYGELVNYCKCKGLMTIPSYKTFIAAVNRRPRYQQTQKRAGSRAAYRHEPMHWELSFTLPRHGDRPFEIAHLDHTQLDVELADSRTGNRFGKPWATFLTDAFSRRVLAVYLTFDEPSYRSAMMVLRECVHRHNRLPELLVVDWGPEFRSTYFETLLARYECSKATRPKAKPRFGSVIERLFGTANTTFVHNLAGNTQVMKQVRQVTKSVDPREHATWTLSTLYARLRQWAYEVYDTREHPALGQTPEEAFNAGMLLSGLRPNRLIAYDDDFIRFTLPSTPKGTAKVQPNLGVKIHSLYYWARGDAFRDTQVEKTQVRVRYDPYDMGHAFACVKGRWVECISEHYARFKGRTEREIQLATEELRQRHRRHGQQFVLTAAKLADFLSSVEAEEVLLAQRQRDHEARGVFSLMEGTLAPKQTISASNNMPTETTRNDLSAHTVASTAANIDRDTEQDDIYEDY